MVQKKNIKGTITVYVDVDTFSCCLSSSEYKSKKKGESSVTYNGMLELGEKQDYYAEEVVPI